MAEPTTYELDDDFTASDKGTQLNVQLQKVQISTESLAGAIADVRRSDGALQNEIVTRDSLAPGLELEIIEGAVAGAIEIATDQAQIAVSAAALAAAWAESPAAPDVDDPASQSAKTWAGVASTKAGEAATSAANAALFDGPKFDTIALMGAFDGFENGDKIIVWDGANGEPEPYAYDASSTLTADGALIVDATGMGAGRLVSTRTVYADFAEFDADARTLANGAKVSIARLVEAKAVAAGGILTTAGRRFEIVSNELNWQAFGVVGDGVTVDTVAAQKASDIAKASGAKLVSPFLRVVVDDTLTLDGIEGDLGGSQIVYKGDSGKFAVIVNSDAGSGANPKHGNVAGTFSVIREDFEEYATFTNTVTYDPPSVPAGKDIGNAAGNTSFNDVVCVGAVAGSGYCVAEFDQLADGCTVTAACLTDGQVRVWWNNYGTSAVDMPSGNLTVTAYNNAYHGIAFGGGLAINNSIRVSGFTGVSVAFGDRRCPTSGIKPVVSSIVLYDKVSALVTPVGGYGISVGASTNANIFDFSFFANNAFGEATPYRASCINALVDHGIGNTYERLTLECVSTGPNFLIHHKSNGATVLGVSYFETNPSQVTQTSPVVEAMSKSSGATVKLRIPSNHRVVDYGVANRISTAPASWINGNQQGYMVSPRNMLRNPNFKNGLAAWSDFSSNNTISFIDGYLGGTGIRMDLAAGRPNLIQSLNTTNSGPYLLANLKGRQVTVSYWVRSTVAGLNVKVANIANEVVPSDGLRRFMTSTIRIPNDSATSISCQIITAGSGLTGFIEISNLSLNFGPDAVSDPLGTVLRGTRTYTIPSLAAGATTATNITVTGANFGDIVTGVSFNADVNNLNIRAHVVSVNTVEVTIANDSAATIAASPAGTLAVEVQT